MTPSCCGPDYDAAFNERTARRDAETYRRSGAGGSSLRLIEAITTAGANAASVLDIGGGVGVIGMELLAAGAASVTEVDASEPYVSVARQEAERRGLADRTTFRHGDFVQLAAEIEPADIVTLDRVVCCYPDWRTMVDRSTAHAERLYGLVMPNERWWLRAAIGLGNLWFRVIGQSFRGFVHPERLIDERIRAAGFRRRLHHRGWVWQTALYERTAAEG